MESFGLFDLFKALFPQSAAENPDAAPAQPPAPDQPDPTPSQTPTVFPPEPAPPNAFLDFIHTHDERAKRTKKK